jgi:hypothetical protein
MRLDIVVEESLLGQEMVTFQQAYDAVAARYVDNHSVSLRPAEITQAIYLEMRRMDAEHVAAELRTSAKRRSSAPPQAEAR